METHFVVAGKPIPKGRPRVTRFGTYNPKSTQRFEAAVREAWQTQSGMAFPADTPLAVHVKAVFPIPQNAGKRAQLSMDGAPHTKRGDADNVAKAVLDALNGHAYPDDGAVYKLSVIKLYGVSGYTEVYIRDESREEA